MAAKKTETGPRHPFKTVILYDKRRVQPETMEAIANCKNGDLIPVDRSEIDAFFPIVIHDGIFREFVKPKPAPPVEVKPPPETTPFTRRPDTRPGAPAGPAHGTVDGKLT